MFTGIVEEVGKIEAVLDRPYGARIKVSCAVVNKDANLGDSIMVNGICLTIAEEDGRTLSFDVVSESLKRTSLDSLKGGDAVNLERAMKADGRFGGHIVSGHIDGTGIIRELTRTSDNVRMSIKASENIVACIVEKGSVTLDGISLTVGTVEKDGFAVFLIPFTLEHTTLAFRKVGDSINIETDMIGKYVKKYMMMGNLSESAITEDMLRENGFL